MNKIKDFTDNELSKYEELYTHIVLKHSKRSHLITKEEEKKRVYMDYLPVLEKYIDEIKETIKKAEGKGFLDIFKDDEIHKQDLLKYKEKIKPKLDKLELCKSCKCLGCTKECLFNACRNCKKEEFIKACDKEESCIKVGLAPIRLDFHDLGETNVLCNVIGLLDDLKTNRLYIYVCDSNDSDRQWIFGYNKNTAGIVTYDALTQEELDDIFDVFSTMNVYI